MRTSPLPLNEQLLPLFIKEESTVPVEQIRQSAFDLASTLEIDISLTDTSHERPYAWDGRTLRIAPGKRVIQDLAHDLAHFQCAAPSRRYKPEFGLGCGYNTCKHLMPLVSHAAALVEEHHTCVLATLWLNHWGHETLSESKLTSLLRETENPKGYYFDGPAEVETSFRWLVSHGLATQDFRPIPTTKNGRRKEFAI